MPLHVLNYPIFGMIPNTNNPASGPSLLVVDDNEINRDLMSLQLRRNGYQVTMAASGYQALEILQSQTFDTILLDIMMPGMNGIEVLEKIRKGHSILALPVIMVTADDQEQSIVDALKFGANDYLIKPLNMEVTNARIKTQLNAKALADLKDEVVQFASHDLKKPLVVMLDIIGELTPNIQANQPAPNDAPELLELVRKTATNMQSVVENFLDTTQLEAGKNPLKCRDVQLNGIILQAIEANTEYAKQKGIALQNELNSNLPTIEADEFRISQVLENLVGNAMKFSPQNTNTTVRTHFDDQYVYTEICDGGPGLTESDMEQLFKKYANISNKPTGNESSTGIGLPLSKQMIEMHHGQIGATNNHGHGATFWFSLPIKQNHS